MNKICKAYDARYKSAARFSYLYDSSSPVFHITIAFIVKFYRTAFGVSGRESIIYV